MIFQNLYSELAINLFNLLSLKTLFPIKVIFLILDLSPNLISKLIFTKFSSSVSSVVSIEAL